MKTLTAAILSLVSINALADKIGPSKDTILPSTVEHVFNIQKESQSQPAIRLIQVDNGGSSDITSFVQPSRLYVTVHQDGEMFDINGNYEVTHAVSSLSVNSYDAKNQVITITFVAPNESNYKPQKHVATIRLTDVLKEIKTVTGDFGDDQSLKSLVGWNDIVTSAAK